MESDSTPAAPAHTATNAEKKSGLEITFERLWLASLNDSGVIPVALKMSVAR